MSSVWHQPGPVPAPAGAPEPGQTDSGAVWALTCAVASFVVPLLPAAVALLLATRAQRRLDRVVGVAGQDMVRSARTLAWVNICLSLTAGVLVIVLAALTSVGNGS